MFYSNVLVKCLNVLLCVRPYFVQWSIRFKVKRTVYSGFISIGTLRKTVALDMKHLLLVNVMIQNLFSANYYFLLDVNECDDPSCSTNATCTNLPGSYLCDCNPGYTGSGLYCYGKRKRYKAHFLVLSLRFVIFYFLYYCFVFYRY